MSIAIVQFVSLGEDIQFVSVGEASKVSILCLKNIVIKILQSLCIRTYVRGATTAAVTVTPPGKL